MGMGQVVKVALVQMTCGDSLEQNYDKTVGYIEALIKEVELCRARPRCWNRLSLPTMCVS